MSLRPEAVLVLAQAGSSPSEEELERFFGARVASYARVLLLIHRDVKPANILFCERGGVPDVVKLVDFGLAKRVTSDPSPSLTQAGALAGTPLYLSPGSHLRRGAPRPPRRPLRARWSGLLPALWATALPGPTHDRSLRAPPAHAADSTPSQRLGTPFPAALEQLVLACLAKKPDDRPRDALELQERLLDCASDAAWSLSEARAWWRAHTNST